MKRILCLWLPEVCDARTIGLGVHTNIQHAASFGVGCGDGRLATNPQGSDQQSWPETLQQLAELCRQFSPTVGVIAAELPDSLLLDVTGSSHLFGSERGLVSRLAEQIARFVAGNRVAGNPTNQSTRCALARSAPQVHDAIAHGAIVHGAIADTPGGAWAVAHWCIDGGWPAEWLCGPGRFVIVPPGRTPAALRRLPIQALRLEAQTIETLSSLGVRWIGQLAVLPRGELAARFGQQLLDRLDQALGRLEEPILPLRPMVRFAAEMALCYPTSSREHLEAILERLLCQLVGQLREAGCGAMQLRCHLRCTSLHRAIIHSDTMAPLTAPKIAPKIAPTIAPAVSPAVAAAVTPTVASTVAPTVASPMASGNAADTQTLRLELGLFEPTCDAAQLLQLLQLQLERLRLPGMVAAVHLEAATTARLANQQTRLFAAEPSGGDRRELAALVNRLCARLGWQAVLGVRLRPEAQPELAFRYVPLVVPSLEDPKGTAQRRHSPGAIRRRASGGAVFPVDGTVFPVDAHRAASGADAQSSALGNEPSIRPLRLLRQPVAVELCFASHRACGLAAPATPRAAEGALLPQFRWRGRVHSVLYAWGPERIETGWWRGQAIGRDYYQIETTTGCRLWIFRQLGDGRWFVHGLFD